MRTLNATPDVCSSGPPAEKVPRRASARDCPRRASARDCAAPLPAVVCPAGFIPSPTHCACPRRVRRRAAPMYTCTAPRFTPSLHRGLHLLYTAVAAGRSGRTLESTADSSPHTHTPPRSAPAAANFRAPGAPPTLASRSARRANHPSRARRANHLSLSSTRRRGPPVESSAQRAE